MDNMATKKIKRCVVKCCSNTSKNTPNKIFLSFPRVPYPKRRKRWLKALGLKKLSSECSNMVCEDHFNLAEDAANWLYYKFMANRIFLKPNVVPHLYLTSPSPYERRSQLTTTDRKIKKETLHSLKTTDTKIAENEKYNISEDNSKKLTPKETLRVNEDTSPYIKKEIKEECLETEPQYVFVKQEDFEKEDSRLLEKVSSSTSKQQQEENGSSDFEMTSEETIILMVDEDATPYMNKKIKEECLETEEQYVLVKQEDFQKEDSKMLEKIPRLASQQRQEKNISNRFKLTPKETIVPMVNEDTSPHIKEEIKEEYLETEPQYVFVKQEDFEKEDNRLLEKVPSLTSQHQQEKNMSSHFEVQTLRQSSPLTPPHDNTITQGVSAFDAQPPALTCEQPRDFRFLEEKSQGLEYEVIERNGRYFLSLPKEARLLMSNQPVPITKK